MNTVGEPDEGKPHVRFDEGRLGRLRLSQSPTLPTSSFEWMWDSWVHTAWALRYHVLSLALTHWGIAHRVPQSARARRSLLGQFLNDAPRPHRGSDDDS